MKPEFGPRFIMRHRNSRIVTNHVFSDSLNGFCIGFDPSHLQIIFYCTHFPQYCLAVCLKKCLRIWSRVSFYYSADAIWFELRDRKIKSTPIFETIARGGCIPTCCYSKLNWAKNALEFGQVKENRQRKQFDFTLKWFFWYLGIHFLTDPFEKWHDYDFKGERKQ